MSETSKIKYITLLEHIGDNTITDKSDKSCLENDDIVNYKGFAVNKFTNSYIQNYEINNNKKCPKVKYLATHHSENEGYRHYFLIKLDKPYKSLFLKDIYYLPVYISSGANTGDICKETKCIIPFFGIATSFQNNITALILKADFIQAFNKTRNYNSVKEFYISNRNEDLKLKISRYFGKEFNKEEMNEYRKKVGSNFIMNIILENKKSIFTMVNNIENHKTKTKTIKYMYELNHLIGENNFLGIRLDFLKKTKNVLKGAYIQKINQKKEENKKISTLESPLLDDMVNYANRN